MKLSDFKVEELRNMQQAIKDTRAKYDGYREYEAPPRNFVSECPLCTFEDSYPGDCEACPWLIFEGIGCVNGDYGFQTTTTRRNRLDRWYNLIEEEIKRREG